MKIKVFFFCKRFHMQFNHFVTSIQIYCFEKKNYVRFIDRTMLESTKINERFSMSFTICNFPEATNFQLTETFIF